MRANAHVVRRRLLQLLSLQFTLLFFGVRVIDALILAMVMMLMRSQATGRRWLHVGQVGSSRLGSCTQSASRCQEDLDVDDGHDEKWNEEGT